MAEGKKEEVPDYYKILSVSPSASYNAVKRAYAKLARTHHPDRGGGEADTNLFSLATEAKTTLMDPARRQAYDRKLSSQHIQTLPKYANGEVPKKRKADPYHVDVDLDLSDVMNGAEKTVAVSPRAVCVDCGGVGTTKGSFTPCKQCNGHGLICTTFNGSLEEGTGQIEATGDCYQCGGIGVRRVRKGQTCKRCDGAGIEKVPTEISVEVPPGIVFEPTGYKIVLPDAGHCRVNGIPGDIVVHARVVGHTISVEAESFTFGKDPRAEPCTIEMERRKNGQHILVRQNITLDQALLGFSVRFRHLDGTNHILVPIKKDQITQSRHGRVLRGGGFPPPPGVKAPRGSMVVQYNVVLPEIMSVEGREHLSRFLRVDEPQLLKQEVSRKREIVELFSSSPPVEHKKRRVERKEKGAMWWWGCGIS